MNTAQPLGDLEREWQEAIRNLPRETITEIMAGTFVPTDPVHSRAIRAWRAVEAARPLNAPQSAARVPDLPPPL